LLIDETRDAVGPVEGHFESVDQTEEMIITEIGCGLAGLLTFSLYSNVK
jgi:hypothetical protein